MLVNLFEYGITDAMIDNAVNVIDASVPDVVTGSLFDERAMLFYAADAQRRALLAVVPAEKRIAVIKTPVGDIRRDLATGQLTPPLVRGDKRTTHYTQKYAAARFAAKPILDSVTSQVMGLNTGDSIDRASIRDFLVAVLTAEITVHEALQA